MSSASQPRESLAVPSGARFGRYEVVAPIGRGGMGEVYRARDTELHRDVALKLLPPEYGAVAERLRRFEQEARAMGQLSHPNVVAVYDVGHADATPFVVTELLEGETLRDVIGRGAMESGLALAYAVQIVQGLAAAHAKGIVHRDLKPANVFVTSGGHVKILDFGVAKLLHPEWDDMPTAQSTITLTMPGTVMGTPAYMSPEQVEGAPLDARSDIFSFGAVLLEMLTGTKAFDGRSPASVVAAILREQPAELVAPTKVPRSVIALLRRCLEKDPDQRFQTARDLAFALEEVRGGSGDASVPSITLSTARAVATQIRKRPALSITGGVAVLATVLALTVVGGGNVQSSAPPALKVPDVRYTRLTTSGTAGLVMAYSPNGVYAIHTNADDDTALWLMHVPTRSETRLTVPAGVTSARFSPDGNYIYFIREVEDEASLYRMPLLGGDPRLLLRNIDASTLSFSRDGGRIAFARYVKRDATLVSQLLVANADGTSERVVASAPEAAGFVGCAWSPDGARFLCGLGHFTGRSLGMYEIDATTGVQKRLMRMREGGWAEWLPDGRIVLANGEGLWRIDYETGRGVKLTNDPASYLYSHASADGNSVASLRIQMFTNLWAVSADSGLPTRQLTNGIGTSDGNFGVATTPEGKIVWAASSGGKTIDLWIADADGSHRRRVTFNDSADERWPNVSPDGRHVVYVSHSTADPGGEYADVWRVPLDGSGTPKQLTAVGDARVPFWAADGERILFTRSVKGTNYIFEMGADGGDAQQLSQDSAQGTAPSPDGRWILVQRDDASYELWPQSGEGERRKLGFGGGPRRWRPDSKAFAFMRGGNIWIYELGAAKPRQLTKLGANETALLGLAWTPDGREIIFSRRQSTRDLVLLENIQ